MGKFSPYDHYYSCEVDNTVRNGITGIGKPMFLQLFQNAQQKIFQQRTIKNALREAGLVPFVLLKILHHLPYFDYPDEQPSDSTNLHSLQPTVPETQQKSKEAQAHMAEIFGVLDMIDGSQSPT